MLIGISGKKQAGKTTTASYILGEFLLGGGLIDAFNIDKENGQLLLDRPIDDSPGHIFSFADNLKWMAVAVFGLRPEQVYGTDDEKNTYTEYSWGDLHQFTPKVAIPDNSKQKVTAREFLEFIGTAICRKMNPDVWVNSCMSEISRAQRQLSIISDVRFPNEVEAVLGAGGKIIRLTRNPFNSTAEPEVALDNYDWNKPNVYVIDNANLDVIETNKLVYGVCFAN